MLLRLGTKAATLPLSLARFLATSTSEGSILVAHPRSSPDPHLAEAFRLAESLHTDDSDGSTTPPTPVRALQLGPSRRTRPSPATFFGRGAVDILAAECAREPPHRVFVNAHLSGVQQRNLEMQVGFPVVDRVGLIIEIFSSRARTREAKLQVELAQLEYSASRLVRVVDPRTGQRRGFGAGGEVEVVSARERGRSGSGSGGLGGAGGGGESELELQGRRLAAKRAALKKQLAEVRRTREVQRAGRRKSGLPTIALVGYTNAGKSSLMAALTKSSVGIEDRLFATLDPTSRRVLLPSGKPAILSDTVGFISDLPVQLVDAFRATLEEATTADLLLHVVDASSKDAVGQRDAVLRVLRGLGVGEERLRDSVVEVWNKSDLLVPSESSVGGDSLVGESTTSLSNDFVGDVSLEKREEEESESSTGLSEDVQPLRVWTSAVDRTGLQDLLEIIESKVKRRDVGEVVLNPFN